MQTRYNNGCHECGEEKPLSTAPGRVTGRASVEIRVELLRRLNIENLCDTVTVFLGLYSRIRHTKGDTFIPFFYCHCIPNCKEMQKAQLSVNRIMKM